MATPLQTVCIFTIILNQVNCSGLNLITKNLNQPELQSTPCVKKLCVNYFHSKRAMKGSLVIMNLTPTPSKFQSKIIQSLNDDPYHEFSVMVKDARKKHFNASHVSEKAQNYFMFISNSKDVNQTIHQWRSLPTWNPLAQVVVLFTETFESDILEIETRNVFNELLNNTMLNINVISHKFGTNIMQVVTWYPYRYNNCANKIQKLDIIDECEYEIADNSTDRFSEDMSEDVVYWPNPKIPKIPHTLHGCPIRIASTIWEPFTFYDTKTGFSKGIEVLLLKTIAEVLNLEPIYYLLNDTRENRNTSSIFQGYTDLVNGESDILIGGMDEDYISRKYLSTSIPYYQDDQTWCVAVAKPEELWKNIFTLFPLIMWFGIIGIMLLIAGIIYVLLKVDYKLENFAWTLLASMSISLGLATTYDPKNSNVRFMFSTFLFYGLIFSSAFHSFLVGVLSNPRQKVQIHKVEDAIGENFAFHGGTLPLAHYDGDESTSTYIRNSYQLCDMIDKCLEKIKTNDYLAVSVSREHALNNPLISKSELFCFPKANNVYSFSVTMMAKRNYHLLPRMNSIIRRVVEFGLIEKWDKEGDLVRQIQLEQKSDENSDDGLVVLTVGHIAGALIIMIAGYFIAVLVFIIEIVINRNSFKLRFRKTFKILDKMLDAQRYFLK